MYSVGYTATWWRQLMIATTTCDLPFMMMDETIRETQVLLIYEQKSKPVQDQKFTAL